MKQSDLPTPLLEDMREQQIDVDLTLSILNRYNAGRYDNVQPVTAAAIPTVDGSTVIDRTTPVELRLPVETVRQRLQRLLPSVTPEAVGTVAGGECRLSEEQLQNVGHRLLPLVSYGVLNGGSATSYADEKKNRSLSKELFDLLQDDFRPLADLSRGRAKGLTPAYINPDGSPGATFLELKMRANLVQALRYLRGPAAAAGSGSDAASLGAAVGAPAGAADGAGLSRSGTHPDEPQTALLPLFPMFQMTSVYNTDEVAGAYNDFRNSPMLRDLIAATGIDITRVRTGVQPLIAAFTHSAEGRPKRVFDHAHGKPHHALPLPGGHGQNFAVLREVYRDLYRIGKRFVYLGNVDNLGFTVDEVSVAYLALTGKQAGFDFSFRTSVDVKGGILVRDDNGRLACADIGPAISPEEVFSAETRGSQILFNCATGLFTLEFLVQQLDRIIEELPMRFSDQDKDAGRYSQAEQVTWEIIGMLDDFLVFGVNKYDRFLAAKMLLETLMTSGRKLDDPAYPTASNPAADLRRTARQLNEGLARQLRTSYALREEQGRWIPLLPEEIQP